MEREEQNGIKTVECLRGRLLAERMASKTAMAEADHMAKKLAELEKQLEAELERRGRAEKKLKHALKKLESVMIVDMPGRMDLSDSSVSSSALSKCFQNNSILGKWKDFETCGSPRSMNSFGDSVHNPVYQDGSWRSAGTASSQNKEDSQGNEMSNSNGYLEVADGTMRQSSKEKSDIEHPVKEILALVPVCFPEKLAACNPEVKNNVYDVLFSLRHARDQLKNST